MGTIRKITSEWSTRASRLSAKRRKALLTRTFLLATSAVFKPIEKGQLGLNYMGSLVPDADLVVEVGANSGQDTRLLLEAFPRAEIWCFEPDPRAIKAWRRNITNPRATLLPIAVGDHSGEVTFHQSDGLPPDVPAEDFPEGWDLSGSIMRPKNHTTVHPWSKFETAISVKGETLDALMENTLEKFSAQQFPIGLIWADVQGAEELLIKGAYQTLKKSRFFYTEYSNEELYEGQVSLGRLISLLPDFRIRRIWTNDVLFENRGAQKS